MTTPDKIRQQLLRIIGKASELSLVITAVEFTEKNQYNFVETLTGQIEADLNYLITECVKDIKKHGDQ